MFKYRLTDQGSRQQRDKRSEIEASQNARKQQRERNEDSHDAAGKASVLPKPFPEDEVAAEERKPKHKVAVLIGYSGTGYRGMQMYVNFNGPLPGCMTNTSAYRNYSSKTIEGDLFTAFVHAGAISKANANDPKKSQLVRCARTDKGVHAAGNVISLKLIVEDPDIVKKINEHLSPQIRVWGIERTVGSFSAYQACDGRWYEYLIPTHSFLPPHPSSWLAKKLIELAEEAGDKQRYEQRQGEVSSFWPETEEYYIKPVLEDLPEWIRERCAEAMYEEDSVDVEGSSNREAVAEAGDAEGKVNISTDQISNVNFAHASELKNISHGTKELADTVETVQERTNHSGDASLPAESQEEDSRNEITLENVPENVKHSEDTSGLERQHATDAGNADATSTATNRVEASKETKNTDSALTDSSEPVRYRKSNFQNLTTDEKRQVDTAIKRVRSAYMSAKRAYRIHPDRLARIQPLLNMFLGTRNFHNYTVQKSFRDPSAKRVIRSFKLNPEPIVINGTEWLSLKIHGQSFMMHQIRKMVGMIALVVRSGTPPERIRESLGPVDASVPKVPGLGLLLERPVFESYNSGRAEKFGRARIDFEQHEGAIEEFKRREIYQRQFREEEQSNAFHGFFAHVDHLRDAQFLYLSSGGFEAVERYRQEQPKGQKGVAQADLRQEAAKVDSDDENARASADGDG